VWVDGLTDRQTKGTPMATDAPGDRNLETRDDTLTRDDEIRLDEDRTAHHRDDDVTTRRTVTERTAAPVVVDRARGGFSFGSVVTGVLVAFGAFIVLSALIGAVMAMLGMTEGTINATDFRNATIGAGIGLVLAQFLAYLWGGYTAGRMARGSGVLNGILVPIVAIVLVALLGAIVAAVAGNINVQAEATNVEANLPLPLSDLADIGTGVGIGVLIAMLLGGALGGHLGSRWHTKLEDHEAEVVA
jgi:hypothetical protein